MAATLARAGDPPAAVQVWEQVARDHPGSGWALRGLHQARLATGDKTGAAATMRALRTAWPGADADLIPPGDAPGDR